MSDRYQCLIANYQLSLNDKAANIEQLYYRLLRSRSTEVRDDLQMYLHRLAGSAGMYGFPEISEQANMIESKLIDQSQKIDELAPEIERLVLCLKQVQSDGAGGQ